MGIPADSAGGLKAELESDDTQVAGELLSRPGACKCIIPTSDKAMIRAGPM